MTGWMDRILAFIAVAGFTLFLFITAYWVRQPDLIAVLVIVVAMVVYDFWVHPWRMRKAAEDRDHGASEKNGG
ncbi:hypothetical protein [Afifella pfennigii]|uniref:hypothetical protein n=1 Tax=Afifella pfennigii TaxID=209897 RepID=UPI000554FDF2|nr:hypothetical protein [Afifella pfennigii]